MGMRAPHKYRMRDIGQPNIINKRGTAGKKSRILGPENSLPKNPTCLPVLSCFRHSAPLGRVGQVKQIGGIVAEDLVPVGRIKILHAHVAVQTLP